MAAWLCAGLKKNGVSGYDVKDIAGIIAPDDEAVRKVMEELVADPAAFYRTGRYNLAELGIKEKDADDIRWLGMVEALVEGGYACILDYKAAPDEVIEDVASLKGMKRLALALNESMMEAEMYVADWCKGQDKQWEEKGCCMGGIDTDSDSYVLFPCTRTELATLSEIASDMGHRITYGANL